MFIGFIIQPWNIPPWNASTQIRRERNENVKFNLIKMLKYYLILSNVIKRKKKGNPFPFKFI